MKPIDLAFRLLKNVDEYEFDRDNYISAGAERSVYGTSNPNEVLKIPSSYQRQLLPTVSWDSDVNHWADKINTPDMMAGQALSQMGYPILPERPTTVRIGGKRRPATAQTRISDVWANHPEVTEQAIKDFEHSLGGELREPIGEGIGYFSPKSDRDALLEAISFGDLHGKNIAVDKDGNLKVIDSSMILPSPHHIAFQNIPLGPTDFITMPKGYNTMKRWSKINPEKRHTFTSLFGDKDKARYFRDIEDMSSADKRGQDVSYNEYLDTLNQLKFMNERIDNPEQLTLWEAIKNTPEYLSYGLAEHYRKKALYGDADEFQSYNKIADNYANQLSSEDYHRMHIVDRLSRDAEKARNIINMKNTQKSEPMDLAWRLLKMPKPDFPYYGNPEEFSISHNFIPWNSEGEEHLPEDDNMKIIEVAAHQGLEEYGMEPMKYGHASFYVENDKLIPRTAYTHPSFRRGGIATDLYNHAEQVTGLPVVDESPMQSEDALRFWENRSDM